MDESALHRSSHFDVINDIQTKEGWRYTANTRRIIIDIAGKARHANPESPFEIWRRMTRYSVTGRKIAVEASVERLRSLLQVNARTNRPRLRIRPTCKVTIAELGGGPHPHGGGMWLRNNQGVPRKDNCDCLKAIAYGMIELYGTTFPEYSARDYDNWDAGPASYLQPSNLENWVIGT